MCLYLALQDYRHHIFHRYYHLLVLFHLIYLRIMYHFKFLLRVYHLPKDQYLILQEGRLL
jgi:hypothetical protein